MVYQKFYFQNDLNFIVNHTIFDFNVLNCVKFKSSDLRIYLGLKTSAAIILIQTEDLETLFHSSLSKRLSNYITQHLLNSYELLMMIGNFQHCHIGFSMR